MGSIVVLYLLNNLAQVVDGQFLILDEGRDHTLIRIIKVIRDNTGHAALGKLLLTHYSKVLIGGTILLMTDTSVSLQTANHRG